MAPPKLSTSLSFVHLAPASTQGEATGEGKLDLALAPRLARVDVGVVYQVRAGRGKGITESGVWGEGMWADPGLLMMHVHIIKVEWHITADK
jgi:hypothetical protein